MWFWRTKYINRRLDRRSALLDVKLRSSQVRAMRLRWGAIALGVSFGTLFGLYLIWRAGEWALNSFLYENKDFAVQQTDIQTDGEISTDQIRRWAGVKRGDNLFALDLARVKRDLELVPRIKSAAIERVLPRTLRIRVSEREPLAQTYAPQLRPDGHGYDMKIFQIDEEACVMLPLEPRQRENPLSPACEPMPTLAGIDPNNLQPGKRLTAPPVRAALGLIVAFERSPMAGLADLRRIDMSSPGVLRVTTGQGSLVIFSLQDFDRQLRRWREIYDHGQKLRKAVAWLDLAVPNNVPLRWVDASTVAPITPKSRTSSNRRRNV